MSRKSDLDPLRLRVMWLGLSFLLLVCVLAIPYHHNLRAKTLGGVIWLLFEDVLAGHPTLGLGSMFAIFCLGIGALFCGMRCLVGKTRLKTGWAIAVGLPLTTFGLGVFLFFGLFLLIIVAVAGFGLPG